jgi:hypothetical protein
MQRVARHFPLISPRLERDLPTLQRIADPYGIRFILVEDSQDPKLDGPNRYAGLDLEARVVFLGKYTEFEHALHEMAHLVTTPPGHDIEGIPEDFVLMQLERCWVEHLPRSLRNSVINWQLDTVASLVAGLEAFLSDNPDYETSPEWLAGFRRSQELGLINSARRPSLAPAVWTDSLLAELAAVMEITR